MDLPGMIGLAISNLEFEEQSEHWVFRFGARCRATVACPWRVVAGNRVAVTNRDHRQKFGLATPVDAVLGALAHLGGRKVVRALVVDGIGDLRIAFDGGVALETFTDSSGYESGSIELPGGESVTVMGGWEIAMFDRPPGTNDA